MIGASPLSICCGPKINRATQDDQPEEANTTELNDPELSFARAHLAYGSSGHERARATEEQEAMKNPTGAPDQNEPALTWGNHPVQHRSSLAEGIFAIDKLIFAG